MSTQDQTNYANLLNSLISSINLYFSTTVVPVGMFLNLITILTFSRAELRKIGANMSVFYTALAIYDLLALTNSILFIQLLPYYNIKLSNFSDIVCKLTYIWRRTTIQSPSIVQTFLTFDRFRGVVCPNRFKYLFDNRAHLILAICLIFPCVCLVNLGHLGYYTVSQSTANVTSQNNVSIVPLICTASSSISIATDIIQVFMRSYIPFTLMLVMNIVMSRRFLHSRKQMLKNQNRSMKREYNFTLTVIGMNLTFFVLFTPWSIWYIMSYATKGLTTWQSPLVVAEMAFFQTVSFSIAYFNNMSSFGLNLAFNALFRTELVRMLRIPLRTGRVSLTTGTSIQTGVNRH